MNNLVDLARFTLMLETLIAFPYKHLEIIGSFWTSDAEIKACNSELSKLFIDSKIDWLKLSIASRLVELEAMSERALQADETGYTRRVGEMMGWAVSKAKQTARKQRFWQHLSSK